MPRLYSIRPTLSLKGRRSQGLRGFTGKPFHPPLTDFPIVCYTLAAVFDLVSFFSGADDPKAQDFFAAATFVMVAGFIVSLGAALTGFMDWWKGIPRDRTVGPIGRAKHTQVWRTINWHATVMLTVTADHARRPAPSHPELRRGGRRRSPGSCSRCVAAVLVMLGAAYGGTLVFEYGFNVENVDEVWNKWEDQPRPPRPSEARLLGEGSAHVVHRAGSRWGRDVAASAHARGPGPSSRSGTVAIVKSVGAIDESSSGATGNETVASGLARGEYSATIVAPSPVREGSSITRPPRFALRNSFVTRSGRRSTTTAVRAAAAVRSASWETRRSIGTTTWRPLPPVGTRGDARRHRRAPRARGRRPRRQPRTRHLQADRCNDEQVGTVEAIRSHRGGVELERGLVAQPSQSRGIVTDRVAHVARRAGRGDPDGPDPVRRVLGRVLLEVALRLQPIGRAHRRHRPAA